MKRSFLERSDKTFFYIEEELFGSKIAGILLSGEHYSIKNPLLYYSRNILFENKIDYYGFDFLYTSNKKYLDFSYEERIKIIKEDTKIVLSKVLEIADSYDELIFISKSSGLYHVETAMNVELIFRKILGIILFSPGNTWNEFIPMLIKSKIETLVIAGSKDRMFNVLNVNKIRDEKHIELVEVKGADHSLEVDNIIKDVENIKEIMEKELRFIKRIYNK